ncbi:sugar porter family MFS transporter [Mycobacterium sp. pUA109]
MGEIAELRRSSPLVLLVGVAAATVGILYGYDPVSGALLFLGNDFDVSSADQEMVATVVVVGMAAGAAVGGWLANTIGRKTSLVAVAAAYGVFAILSALAVSLPMLLVMRLLLGVAIGVSVVVVPVFVAESVPASVRGSLLVAYGLMSVVGIIIGYLVSFLLSDTHNWRLMLGSAAVPAVLMIALLLKVPDSARWYMLKGRVADARRTMLRVEPRADAEKELAEIARAQQEEERAHAGVLREMLQRSHLRATIFLIVFGFFTQITGINAIVFYGPLIFKDMGFEGNFNLLVLPALVQVAAVAAMCVSLVLIDRLGRRPILLSGIAVMIVANLALIGAYAEGPLFGAALPYFQFTAVLLFSVGYHFGFGSVAWVYGGESLPAKLRSIGSSVMLTTNLTANAIVVGVFLTMLTTLGGATTFAVFGVLALLSFGFIYRYAPETKGIQLEYIRHFWENGGRWPATMPTATDAESSAHRVAETR